MNIAISENLKGLRKSSGMTQEYLASKLCVSPQSVSKWERGEAYPDITLLVSIAGLFGITVDALLGNDKVQNERKIKEYCEEFRHLTGNGGRTGDTGEYEKALALAGRAYGEFPDECSVIMQYVTALKVYSKEDHSEKIEHLCQKVLQSTDDPRLISEASYHLYGLRSAEDRKFFVESFISCGEDPEWFRVYPCRTEEGRLLEQHCILDKWWYLNMEIYTYGDFFEEMTVPPVTHEEKILLLKKCQAVFYAVFDKDDLGEYTFYEGQYNEFLCREYLYVGKTAEALCHFEKAVNGWVKYNSLPQEYEYRDILYAHRPYIKKDLDGPYTMLSRYREDVDRSVLYDAIRDDRRFGIAYAKLCGE